MVRPPNPSLPRYNEHTTNSHHSGSLHNEKPHAEPSELAPPASLAPSHGSSSTLVKVLSGLALVPLLYCIHAFLLTPLAHSIGHGLVRTLSSAPSSAVVTGAAGQGLHSLGKRELEKGSGEFIAFACLIPILVIL